MREKRRCGNWDGGNRDDGGRWPPKSPRRWGQQNDAGFNAWRVEEGSTKPALNGWGDRFSTAPSWERTFYTAVCRVPWRKICDAKRVTSIYKNVTEWDDSAGREALENAKARYWAKINRLPCNIPLPDPCIYVDKVNFDTFIDPGLAADLERVDIIRDTDTKSVIIHLDTSAHGTVPATGCDEADHSSTNWDKYIEKPLTASGWDAMVDTVPGNAWVGCNNGWSDGIVQCDPWGSRRNHSVDVNGRESSWKDRNDTWRHTEGWKNGHDRRNNSWKNMNSWYPVDDDRMRNNCNCSGGNNWNDHSFGKKVQPQRTWQRGQFLESRNHQRTGFSGSPWQRENAVS